MKILIRWYSDEDYKARKFLHWEVLENPNGPKVFYVAHFTIGAIWKHIYTRTLSESEFDAELRKLSALKPRAT
jgi:predicted nucleic acid-binding protein